MRPISSFRQPHFHTEKKAQGLPEWGWQKAEWGFILR
jgi:hypothetical protein